MFSKIIHFIKYNNLTVLLILAVFLLGGGVFAQTTAGQEIIGTQAKKIEGVDNTLLLAADLDNLNMDFKIEKIEEDNKYYYVAYTFLDLVKSDGAWQYQIQEKIKKVSKKLKGDLGVYLAGEMKEEYQAKIKDLKAAKAQAEEVGSEKRVEVAAYSGLIGQTLNIVGQIFPAYEPIKRYEIPSPSIPPTILMLKDNKETADSNPADDLTDVYQEYVKQNDPDGDSIFGSLDNCPNTPNPLQEDQDDDNIGDACDPENNMPVADSETATSTEPTDIEPTDTSTSTPAVEEGVTPDSDSENTAAEPTEVQVIELPTE